MEVLILKNIQIGLIGLGQRGYGLLDLIILEQGEAVVAVCDNYEDRLNRAAQAVEKAGQKKPKMYLWYRKGGLGVVRLRQDVSKFKNKIKII